MNSDIKQDLVSCLKQAGAYEVRVANPAVGFEHAIPGRHPLDHWEQGKSVIVFTVASSPKTNNTYIGPYAPWQGDRNLGPVPQDIQSDEKAMDRLSGLFISSIKLKGITLLQTKGYTFSFSLPQAKLSAFEAGIGVYGRSGVIIHPVIGNRMALGMILTDAILEPDDRLENFDPCVDCDLCIKICPANAFDTTKKYPDSFSRDKCLSKRKQIAERGLYCHDCWAVCPASEFEDTDLLSIKEAISHYELE